jgi:tetratricopeptide (TPR) repeat protein
MNSLERGIALYHEEKYHEALTELSRSLKQSASEQAYYYQAMTFLKLSLLDKSLAGFESALSLSPKNAHYISQKAVVLLLMGKKKESLRLFDQAVEWEPQNPYRYSSRAYAKESLGDTHGAIQDYKRCIELDPQDAVAYNNLGLLEEKLGYNAKPRFQRADFLASQQEPNTQSMIEQIKAEQKTEKETAKKRILEISQSAKQKAQSKTLLGVISEALFTAEGRKEFFEFVMAKLFGKK